MAGGLFLFSLTFTLCCLNGEPVNQLSPADRREAIEITKNKQLMNVRLRLLRPNYDRHISGRRICPCSSLHQEAIPFALSEFSG